MPSAKSRINPELRQGDFTIRETFLRIEPRVDLFIREKWIEGHESKLPVVLLHGAGMDSAGYDIPVEDISLVDALARHGSRTFIFDFRGHGRSSRVEDGRQVTVENSVIDTLAVLDFVREVTGTDKVVLLGESYGSIVASVVAERVPERIAGLVLLGFFYGSINPSIEASFAELANVPAGYAFTTEEEWPELFIPTSSPAVTAWHQAHFGTAYAYPVGPYLAVTKLPLVKAPERITSHVLVVTGDLDPVASVEDIAAFFKAISTKHVRHLHQEGVGHLPYVEARAQEVQSAIVELIDEVSNTH